MLGVQSRAESAIVPASAPAAVSSGSGGVNIKAINIDIRVDGSGSPKQTADGIAHEIGIALEMVMENIAIESI